MNSPPWPSLYDPGIELRQIAGGDPIQPTASYLYNPNDVFRFMFYWTLVLYVPVFTLCGVYAFLNILFPPSLSHERIKDAQTQSFPLRAYPSHSHPSRLRHPTSPEVRSPDLTEVGRLAATDHIPTGPSVSVPVSNRVTPPMMNPRRTRFTYALLVLFIFIASGVFGAVVGSAVLAYILVGLFQAGHFNMSTWIPFLFALVQALIGLLGVWPSVIEII